MSIAFITHPSCELHDMGAGHPERPQRLSAIYEHLAAGPLDRVLQRHDAPRGGTRPAGEGPYPLLCATDRGGRAGRGLPCNSMLIRP